jgi:hypothetical protein
LNKRICLVSSSHVGSNPRLVKAADALHAAGYDVRVVSADVSESVRARDADVLRRSRWRHVPIGRGSRLGHASRALRQRLASALQPALPTAHWRSTAWAESWLWRRLADAAASEPADLFIGHNLPALAAVVAAARRRSASCAFDLEDDHCGELPPEMRDSARYQARDAMLRTLLPSCRFVTASSPGIARLMQARYGVAPRVVRNVFPLGERDGVDPPPRPVGSPLRLYWYSQTVGLDRGLSALIAAVGATGLAPTLTLRGEVGRDVRSRLGADAAAHSVHLRFEPLASPGDMTRLAARHDIGACVELADGGNRDVALANKLFTYALAGLPMILSATSAHREFAERLGDAAFVLEPDSSDSVDRLRTWLTDADGLRARSMRSWKLGSTQLNWDAEQSVLLEGVREALGG